MTGTFLRMARSRLGQASYGAFILATTAVVLISFHVVYGYPVGDSTRFNVPWATAFSAQFWSGDWFPRWLIDYPLHVGSPVFYFYGPLPFFLVAGIKGIAPGLSPTEALTVLHALLYLASGAAFYIWVARYTGKGIALIGACLYMAAPYHIFDLEFRNAIGEAIAFILLPLIFSFLLDVEDRGYRWIWASVAYAALIASHLPSALLATPFMMLAAAVVYRQTPGRGLLRLSAIGICGALLAGPYWVPAIMLRSWLPSNAWLYDASFWPETWLLPHGFFYRAGGFFYGGIFATMVVALLLYGIARWSMRGRYQKAPADAVAVVALIGLAIVVFLLSAASTWLWVHIGPLRNVQFPFRLGVVSDFLSVTLMTLALRDLFTLVRVEIRPTIHVITVALMGALMSNLVVFTDLRDAYATRLPTLDSSPLTCCALAPEYWMASVLNSRLYGRLGKWNEYQMQSNAFAPVLAARPLEPDESLALSQSAGRLLLDASLSAPASVRIGQAFMPEWELRPAGGGETLSLLADPETGLITTNLPAGHHRFELFMQQTPAESWGKRAGLAGVLLFGACLILARRGAAKAMSTRPHKP